MSRKQAGTAIAVLVCSFALLPGAARAGAVSKTVDFALGTWWDLDVTDGQVTLHRIRLVEETGPITKSKILRPTGAEYLKTVQIQLEFSNGTTRDWDAHVRFEWLDADGVVIDGYNGNESLDDNERHDVQTMTISTLRYGLARAKTIKIAIDFGP